MPLLVSLVVSTSVSVWVWLATWSIALWLLPSSAWPTMVGVCTACIIVLYAGFARSYVAVSDSRVTVRNLIFTRRIPVEAVTLVDRVHLIPVLGQVDAYFLRVEDARWWRRFVLLVATSRFEGPSGAAVREWLERTELADKW